MPIRKGDGTGISPSGISQVRTGDGRILFDGPAILDSAVYHWEFDEGSGDTITDSVEGVEGEISDTDWIEDSSWWGGAALDFDGSGDVLIDSGLSEFADILTDEWTIAFTLQTEDESGYWLDFGAGGWPWIRFEDNDDDGGINFRVRDADTADLEIQSTGEDSDWVVDDDEPHLIVGVYDGGGIELFNGTDSWGTDSGTLDDAPDEFDPATFGSRDGSSRVTSVMDNIIIVDEAWGEDEIEDWYDLQPWS